RLGKYPQLASRLDPAVVQQLVIQQTAQPAAAMTTTAIAAATAPATGPGSATAINTTSATAKSAATTAATTSPAAPTTKSPMETQPTITIDDFAKLDLRAALVLEASRVDGSDKLLQLKLDLGTEQRNVFSGIAAFYKPEDLVGRHVVMI